MCDVHILKILVSWELGQGKGKGRSAFENVLYGVLTNGMQK